MDYNDLLKLLKSENLQFSPQILDSLNQEERLNIEKEILRFIKKGEKTSYKYLPYLKNIYLIQELNSSTLSNLPLIDRVIINKYLYDITKNKICLDNIILASLSDLESFKILFLMLNESEDKELFLKIILSIIKYTKREEYLDLLKKMNFTSNIDLEKLYSSINPKDIIPNTSLTDNNPVMIMDLNGRILESNEAIEKINFEYNNYLQNEKFSEIVLSGILGFAIGDALGVPIEFTSRTARKIRPIKNMIGYGSHNVEEGTWSDDTSMTIATIDSIIRKKNIDYEDIMNNFVLWKNKAKFTATDKVFDIGITTSEAITRYQDKNLKAVDCGNLNFNDNGNGSLMRMLPIVFYLHNTSFNDDIKARVINYSSAITHAHEISKLGCKIYADFIERLIVNNCDKYDAYNYIKKINYSNLYTKESIEAYRRILQDDISKFSINDIKSTGYIVDTLEASLWSTLTSSSFEEAIIKAINLGGDTDTIGAISGSINGIIYKYKTFPERWTSKLKKKDYLINLSLEYAKILEKNKQNDFLETNEQLTFKK